MIDVDMAQQSPRIRTKTNLLPPKVDEEYSEIIEQLRLGRINVEQYHNLWIPSLFRRSKAKLEEARTAHDFVSERLLSTRFIN